MAEYQYMLIPGGKEVILVVVICDFCHYSFGGRSKEMGKVHVARKTALQIPPNNLPLVRICANILVP